MFEIERHYVAFVFALLDTGRGATGSWLLARFGVSHADRRTVGSRPLAVATLRQGRRKIGGIVGQFVALPHFFIKTPQWAALSGRAVKLLIELELQYNGNNNGDLAITRTAMRSRGFPSTDQLMKARDDLVRAGWIFVTRQGGRNIPSLYGLSYRAVDPCGGKVAAGPPSHLWRPDQAQYREPRTRRGNGATRGFKANQKAKALDRDTEQPVPRHGTALYRDTEQGNGH